MINKICIQDINYKFKETFDVNITLDYEGKWEEWHIIREFVSNALDSVAMDTKKIDIKIKDDYVYLQDKGKGFELNMIKRIGATSKRGDKSTIGTFGEGVKIAILTCIRKNISVMILSNNWLITPKVVDDQGQQVLYYDIFTSDESIEGTKIILEGTPKTTEIFNHLDEYFLIYSKEKCLYGNYLKGIFPLVNEKAKVYNRGVFVKDIEGIFSYAINLSDGLNRDRDIIDHSDIFYSIKDIWREVSEISLIKKLLELYLKPSNEKRYYIECWGSIASDHSDIWAKALMDIHGKGACISNNDISAREAKSLGFNPIMGISWDVATILKDGGIKEDIDMLSDGYEFEWVETLSSKEEEILNKIQSIAKTVGFKDTPNHIIVFSKYYMDECVKGCYNHKSKEIYLKQEILQEENIVEILNVYLHECIHHETGADDLDRRFSSHILKKLSNIIIDYTSKIGIKKTLKVTEKGIILPDDFKLSAKDLTATIAILKDELIIIAGNIPIRYRLKEVFEKPSIYKRKIKVQDEKFTLCLPKDIRDNLEEELVCTVSY